MHQKHHLDQHPKKKQQGAYSIAAMNTGRTTYVDKGSSHAAGAHQGS